MRLSCVLPNAEIAKMLEREAEHATTAACITRADRCPGVMKLRIVSKGRGSDSIVGIRSYVDPLMSQ